MKIKDIIYREDAINLCEKWRNRTNEHHDKNGWYIADTLLKAIKELPSADRPQGEWIEHKWAEEVEGVLISNYECSECHSWKRRASNFCPSCGAQMKGADDVG